MIDIACKGIFQALFPIFLKIKSKNSQYRPCCTHNQEKMEKIVSLVQFGQVAAVKKLKMNDKQHLPSAIAYTVFLNCNKKLSL